MKMARLIGWQISITCFIYGSFNTYAFELEETTPPYLDASHEVLSEELTLPPKNPSAHWILSLLNQSYFGDVSFISSEMAQNKNLTLALTSVAQDAQKTTSLNDALVYAGGEYIARTRTEEEVVVETKYKVFAVAVYGPLSGAQRVIESSKIEVQRLDHIPDVLYHMHFARPTDDLEESDEDVGAEEIEDEPSAHYYIFNKEKPCTERELDRNFFMIYKLSTRESGVFSYLILIPEINPFAELEILPMSEWARLYTAHVF